MFIPFTTPQWFSGYDLVFNAITLCIAFAISLYSYRVYNTSSDKKFKYFSLAFLLICVAFLFKLATYSVLYYIPVRDVADVMLHPITQGSVQLGNLFYRLFFFMQMFPLLASWMMIYLLSQKSRERLTKFYELSQIALFGYFVLLVSIVANFRVFIYYATSLVILALVLLNYFKTYVNNGRKRSTYFVFLSFLSILVSQVFFLFVFWIEWFYFFGELFMLLGFIGILYSYWKATRTKAVRA